MESLVSISKIAKCALYTLESTCYIFLVMFISGDGKSHYIRNKLQMCSFQVAIPVNESFSPLSVITRLRLLPLNTEVSESEVYGIFFNFTMCYPKVSSIHV